MGDIGVAVSKDPAYRTPDVEPVQGGRRRENYGQSDTSFKAKSQLRGTADTTSMTECVWQILALLEWEWNMMVDPALLRAYTSKGL